MSIQTGKQEETQVVIYMTIIAIVFFCFIMPKLEKYHARDTAQIKEKMESLTSNSNKEILKVDELKCSKECCNHTQWPVPHMPKVESTKYVPTNFMCSGGNSAGCPCITEDQLKRLSSRGKNFTGCH